MAREVVARLEEDEDSWKVRCLGKLYRARRLSLLLEGRSLPLLTTTLYIFTELCERPWRKYINGTRHRYLTSLVILRLALLSTDSFLVASRDALSKRFPVRVALRLYTRFIFPIRVESCPETPDIFEKRPRVSVPSFVSVQMAEPCLFLSSDNYNFVRRVCTRPILRYESRRKG